MAKPEKVFKAGPVRASVFQNTATKNGKPIRFPKVVVEVRYRDKTGQWKGTNSLSLRDLPKAVYALEKAYAYLLEKPQESSNASEGGASAAKAAPTSNNPDVTEKVGS